MRSSLGAGLVRVDRFPPAHDHIIVDPVLDIRCRVLRPEYPLVVGVVFGKQQRRISIAMQQEAAELGMRRFDRDRVRPRPLSQGRFRLVRPPGPGVAKPNGRQHVQGDGLRSMVAQADLDQDVGRIRLGILGEHVEIPIFVEYSGIEQFIFPVVTVTAPVSFDKIVIWIGILRIFI